MTKPVIDPRLAEWATPTQLKHLETANECGSMRKAAAKLGAARSAITGSIARLKKVAALHGYAPTYDLTHPVAPGQRLRGASSLYRRGEADPLLTWVKSSADDEAREAIMREAYAAKNCRA